MQASQFAKPSFLMERLPRLLGNKSYLPSGRIVLARRWARHINVNDCVSAEPEKLIIGLPRRPSFCQESLFQFKEPGGGVGEGPGSAPELG